MYLKRRSLAGMTAAAVLLLISPVSASAATLSYTTNLALWLKPESLPGGTGSLATWTDDAALGGVNSATATGTAQPTYGAATLNGYSMVSFDGSNDVMLGSGFSMNGVEAFIVGRIKTGTANNEGVLTFNDGSALDYVGGNTAIIWSSGFNSSGAVASGGDSRWRGAIGTSNQIANVVNPLNSLVIYGFSIDASNANVRINGSGAQSLQLGSGPLVSTLGGYSGSIANAPTQYALGSRLTPGPSNYSNSDIAEVLIYTQALTEGQRLHVQNYLATKYAIPNVVVPEPASAVMLLIGLATFVRLARREGR